MTINCVFKFKFVIMFDEARLIPTQTLTGNAKE